MYGLDLYATSTYAAVDDEGGAINPVVTVSLGGLTATAVVAVTAHSTAAATLGALTVTAAAGLVPPSATVVLGGLTSTAVAAVTKVYPSASVSLGGLTATVNLGVALQVQAAAPLGGLTATAITIIPLVIANRGNLVLSSHSVVVYAGHAESVVAITVNIPRLTFTQVDDPTTVTPGSSTLSVTNTTPALTVTRTS